MGRLPYQSVWSFFFIKSVKRAYYYVLLLYQQNNAGGYRRIRDSEYKDVELNSSNNASIT